MSDARLASMAWIRGRGARESDFRRFRESIVADHTNYRVPVSCVPSVARRPNGSSPHDRTIAAFPDIVCALPSVTDGRSGWTLLFCEEALSGIRRYDSRGPDNFDRSMLTSTRVTLRALSKRDYRRE